MKVVYRVLFAWVVLVVLGVGAILLIPRSYQVKATLIPVEQKSAPGFSNVGGALAASLLGAGSLSTSSRVIRSVLESATIKREVVLSDKVFDQLVEDRKFRSAKESNDPSWGRVYLPTLISQLAGLVNVVTVADGPIVIDVISKSPDLSFEIAQSYINSLEKILKERTSTQAKRKREFTERLVAEKTVELADLRKKLLNFDAQGNIQNLSPELISIIEETSELERRRSSVRMQQEFLSKYSEFDIDSKLNQSFKEEIARLDSSIHKLLSEAKKKTTNLSSSGVSRPSGKIPLVALEYQVALAEVKVLSELVASLERELELLKIEEVSDEISFQVLDKPIPADIPVYPQRKQMSILWIFFVTFLGLLYLIKRERIHQISQKLRARVEKSFAA